MSKKLEKLKEVNDTLSVILNDLETQLFIEDINKINISKQHFD
jgi:hypothetical protein